MIPKQTHRKKKPPKNIPSSLRRAIYDRDINTCQYCGEIGTSIHHIISAGMGRRKRHQKENLILLCAKCHHELHSGKKSEELQEWCEDWSRRRYGNVVDLIKKELRA
jgi:5-methylcytosine-specific restriction endonuclease McrA